MMCYVVPKLTYMKASIIEKDVVFVVVFLQELACLVGRFRADARQIEHGLLRRRKVDLRRGRHGASRKG